MPQSPIQDLLIPVEPTQAQNPAPVQHPFPGLQKPVGPPQVRYKGLAKNTAQLFSLFGLAHLVLARRQLLASPGSIAS
ncbi:Hypothetical Protein RRSL_00092 [Ralstonia solanacearum UW551]|uniref:Transposase n=1 Tax=Ralstonia solanacearum (strain UW551) TaxID=342110 RepID=A0AB33V792_RALSU|nr:Hypothetical Protein RRSL_00092 [Ralstonia solanacearum UW551]